MTSSSQNKTGVKINPEHKCEVNAIYYKKKYILSLQYKNISFISFRCICPLYYNILYFLFIKYLIILMKIGFFIIINFVVILQQQKNIIMRICIYSYHSTFQKICLKDFCTICLSIFTRISRCATLLIKSSLLYNHPSTLKINMQIFVYLLRCFEF